MRWKSWFAGAVFLAVALLFTSMGCGGDGASGGGERDDAAATGEEVESMLPEGALVVLRGNDLEGFWTRLQGTRLYAELAAIEDVREAFGPMAESRREFQARTGMELDPGTIMAIFGDRFDLGVYGQLREDRPDALLVADVRDETVVRELLQALETRLAQEHEAAFVDMEYEGTTIRAGAVSDTEGDSLFHAMDGERLIVATSQARIESGLDTSSGRAEGATMADDARFVDVTSRLGGNALLIYFDQEAIREASEAAASDAEEEGEAAARRLRAASLAFGDFQIADGFAWGVRWVESGIQGESVARVPEDTRSELARMFTASPGEVRTLSFQPVGTMVYGAINSLDAGIVYQELKRYAVEATRIQLDVAGTADSLQADSLIDRNLEAFEARSGIDLEEDLVAWIGSEVAFAIAGVDRTGFFPIPESALTVAVADRARAEAFFGKLEGLLSAMARDRASIPLQWQTDEYEGETIRYAPTPLGEGLAISYTVGSEFAVVATSRGLARRMLDARAGRVEAMPSNPDFGAMTEFYPQRVTSIGFADLESIFTEVESLMGTLGQMSGNASSTDSDATSDQILRAMKNAPRMGFYSEVEDSSILGRFLLEVR